MNNFIFNRNRTSSNKELNKENNETSINLNEYNSINDNNKNI